MLNQKENKKKTDSHEMLISKLKNNANTEKANLLSGFFKTGKGQYGEGDKFLGITVPMTRTITKTFRSMPLCEILKLLRSEWHEARLAAVLLMAWQFSHSDEKTQEKIFNSYLGNSKYINNWDLVDLSCPAIIGNWLLKRDRHILRTLAKSKLLWDRRIAMVSCISFIREGENKDAFEIAEMLLNDREELIHKAIGWMLRETMKHCGEAGLLSFLEQNYSRLPRVTLRYAIEKFPKEKRKKFLKGYFR